MGVGKVGSYSEDGEGNIRVGVRMKHRGQDIRWLFGEERECYNDERALRVSDEQHLVDIVEKCWCWCWRSRCFDVDEGRQKTTNSTTLNVHDAPSPQSTGTTRHTTSIRLFLQHHHRSFAEKRPFPMVSRGSPSWSRSPFRHAENPGAP